LSIDVEIDESLFFKRKTIGEESDPCLGFCCDRKEQWSLLFIPVICRNSETLIVIINSRILSGSRIISDQWASYRCLSSNPNIINETINHSHNFVSPDNLSIHTQNVENLSCHVKRKLRNQFGTQESMLEGYL
jgi:hypothetical protein